MPPTIRYPEGLRDLVRQSWRYINMIELADGDMIEMVPIGPGVIGLVYSPSPPVTMCRPLVWKSTRRDRPREPRGQTIH